MDKLNDPGLILGTVGTCTSVASIFYSQSMVKGLREDVNRLEQEINGLKVKTMENDNSTEILSKFRNTVQQLSSQIKAQQSRITQILNNQKDFANRLAYIESLINPPLYNHRPHEDPRSPSRMEDDYNGYSNDHADGRVNGYSNPPGEEDIEENEANNEYAKRYPQNPSNGHAYGHAYSHAYSHSDPSKKPLNQRPIRSEHYKKIPGDQWREPTNNESYSNDVTGEDDEETVNEDEIIRQSIAKRRTSQRIHEFSRV